MRAAKFADHWRATFKRKYPLSYLGLNYSGIRSLVDSQIKFSPGITAIVGGNGVGKSTLAHAIADVLAGTTHITDLRELDSRLDGSSLEAHLIDTTGAKTLTLVHGADGRITSGTLGEHVFEWIEPSTIAMLCQKQVLGDPAFRDNLEGIGQRTLSPTELASASYVVGKDYEKCVVSEIHEYGPFEIWPYFEVTCSGVTYGSENMGRGELAVLTALWSLDAAPQNSILIIEDPETHVSARSQSAFMDLLAWSCATRGLWAIVTTHSPAILQKLPKEHVRLLVSEGGKSRLISLPNLHEISTIIGGGVAFKTLILVEDECAQSFLLALLEQLDSDLRRQCSAASMNGESEITSILENFPVVSRWTQLVGCFDGDMRTKIKSKFPWPHIFLPGNLPPEPMLRNTLAAADISSFANELHIPTQTVSVALSAAYGLDSHDWLKKIAIELDRSIEEVIRPMTRLWLKENLAEGQSFVADLKKAIAS
ncbi:putative ATPase [Variovorax boronicumulans]|uniref:ATP-dependent nuclease n=1 Tax=Variovorax boronicumulans TaxID=436515 RepID=UPI00278943FB|nr:AAA family ATPase [Variovorax boronicumulans]MDQ0035439.1 putative ATPase [Variovorax boronicumulans]